VKDLHKSKSRPMWRATMLLSNEEKLVLKQRFENQKHISDSYKAHFGESDYTWHWMGQLGYRFSRMSNEEIQTWADHVDIELSLDTEEN